MRRREFFTLLGGAAAAWPLAARAQQGERVRRIGVLMPLAADDPEATPASRRFPEACRQLGWTDGRNLRIDIRWGGGDADRLRKNAAELVALAPDVILAAGGAAVAAAPGDPHRADRIRAASSIRSARLRRKPRAAGRQRDRVYRFEYGIGDQMARAAQRARAQRDASGGSRRSGNTGRGSAN